MKLYGFPNLYSNPGKETTSRQGKRKTGPFYRRSQRGWKSSGQNHSNFSYLRYIWMGMLEIEVDEASRTTSWEGMTLRGATVRDAWSEWTLGWYFTV